MRPLYLRVSLTDRCNLRCLYCRPGERSAPTHGSAPSRGSGPQRCRSVAAGGELDDETWVTLLRAVARVIPVGKIRFTGGEPLLRPRLARLVGRLARTLRPTPLLALTTNGLGLPAQAAQLAAAGMGAVNISIDAADDSRLARIAPGASVGAVLHAIEAARSAGLGPIKLNAVLLRSLNGDQLLPLVQLAARQGCELRFIELMPMGPGRDLFQREQMTAQQALELVGRSYPVLQPLGSRGSSQRYRLDVDGQQVTLGVIPSVSRPFCADCDRLRLDAGGRLYACLRQTRGVDLRAALRHEGQAAVGQLVRHAVDSKQRCHPPHHGAPWPRRPMVAIGG